MADTPIGNLVVNLKYNGTEFHEGVQATKREIKKLNSTLKTAKAETDLYGKGTASASKQLNVMKDLFKQHNHNIEQQQAHYAKLQAKLKGYDDAVKKGTLTAKQANKIKAQTAKRMQSVQNEIAKSATQMAKLKNSYSEVAREQYLANSRLNKWSKGLTTAGAKQEQLGRKVADFGNKLSFMSGAIGITGGLAVREAVKFESAFAGVKKTVSATEFEFAELSNSIREMSKTIPVGVNELNRIAESAGQLGITKENLLGFTETMAKLGATTDMSSTDAANSLARLANITGLSQDKFNNLGSAIVGLGNEFATTESEITEMSLGIAGAGAQLGLSEADILGISAALSSLGIASERGGSSMSKALIQMSTAAANGGEDLDKFAKVAGVTSEEFANMFNSNPTEALALFVDGLGSASEKGTTAVAMLEEMGIKEIRLRDTLLRAGSASELFTKAIKKSNSAFEENSDLNEEYSKRAETFESKLTVAKNKLTDVSITMGNELLPVLSDLIDESEPLIQGTIDAVKWFAALDSETKSLIGKLGLLSFAGGPVISLLGNIVSTGGIAKQALGGIGNTISEKLLNRAVRKGLGDITGEVAGIGAKAIATKGSVSALGGVLGGFGSVVPVLGGVTAAIGVGYAAWKIFGEDALNAKRDTETFGVAIDEGLRPHLRNFENTILELGTTLDGGLGLDKPVEAVDTMLSEINATAKLRIAELEKDFAKLPADVQEIVSSGFDNQKNVFMGYQGQAQEVQASIKAIYKKASEERRELTDKELAYVEQQTERMYRIMATLSTKTEEESAKVYENLTNSTGEMTRKQLQTTKKTLEKENKVIEDTYEERKQILDKQYESSAIDYVEHHNSMNKIDEDRKDSVLTNAVKMKEIWEENGRRANQSTEEIKEQVAYNLRAMGLEYDEVAKHAEHLNEVTEETAKWIAEDSKSMSESVKQANDVWNGLVLEDKEGKLKSNPKEFISEVNESEGGWENLKFAIKYANVSSDALEKIKEGLVANGWWEDLDPETKHYLTETNSFRTLEGILSNHETWNALTYEEKVAILNSNTVKENGFFLNFHRMWENTAFVDKLIEISTTSPEAEKEINELINTYRFGRQQTSGTINLNTYTDAGVNAPKVKSWNDYVGAAQNKSVSLTTTYFSKYVKDPEYEKGTTFHKGGPAILGDGGRREPYLTPQGHFGVSPDTDTRFNLPTGTKVWSSITKFRSQAGSDSRLRPYLGSLPKYATGTDKSFLDETRVPNVFNNSSDIVRTVKVENDNRINEVIGLLQSILSTQNKPIVLDSGQLVGGIADKMDDYFGEELI